MTDYHKGDYTANLLLEEKDRWKSMFSKNRKDKDSYSKNDANKKFNTNEIKSKIYDIKIKNYENLSGV